MNKNDEQIFSDYERNTLKKSLDKINDELGIHNFDIKKQNQILSGRLQQMSYLYKNKTSHKRGMLLGGILGSGSTLVASGIALALTFTFGIVASQLYSSYYGNKVSSLPADVLRSGVNDPDKLIIQAVTTQNPVTERSKYLEAALRAELKIEFLENAGTPTMQVFGLEPKNPKQLEFKAITGLSPTQSGSVIFTFNR